MFLLELSTHRPRHKTFSEMYMKKCTITIVQEGRKIFRNSQFSQPT